MKFYSKMKFKTLSIRLNKFYVFTQWNERILHLAGYGQNWVSNSHQPKNLQDFMEFCITTYLTCSTTLLLSLFGNFKSIVRNPTLLWRRSRTKMLLSGSVLTKIWNKILKNFDLFSFWIFHNHFVYLDYDCRRQSYVPNFCFLYFSWMLRH